MEPKAVAHGLTIFVIDVILLMGFWELHHWVDPNRWQALGGVVLISLVNGIGVAKSYTEPEKL